MSSAPIIRAAGLGKRYRLQHKTNAPYKRLSEELTTIFKRKKISTEDFWALREISFELQQGDVVGVVGRNGAGKSTLLKLLSRITSPTEGRIELDGRVASLLEVGTGFHPELTGRENIFLNGAILGMSKAEIRSKFDEIVAFAEVERFLDTPVKRYSSGMYVRLAFAVAAHLEPEILIVDEVLAVGDTAFQKKCLGKMGDIAKGGRTVIFVSHNLSAVRALCDRAILLRQGRLAADGTVTDVLAEYAATTGGDTSTPEHLSLSIEQAGSATASPTLSEDLTLVVKVTLSHSGKLALNPIVYDALGTAIFTAPSWPKSVEPGSVIPDSFDPATYEARVTIPAGILNAGEYTVTFLILSEANEILEEHQEALRFQIADDGFLRDRGFNGKWIGTSRPQLKWEVSKVG